MDLLRVCRLLGRGFRLRCPRCGARTLFGGLFSMYPDCVKCGLKFEREQGYFIGAIYVNYAVTAIITIAGYVWLDRVVHLSLAKQLILWITFGACFPLFFFRYARSIWLSIDYLLDPENEPGNRI
jgi:uncharacterized protein (DUF983 family)